MKDSRKCCWLGIYTVIKTFLLLDLDKCELTFRSNITDALGMVRRFSTPSSDAIDMMKYVTAGKKVSWEFMEGIARSVFVVMSSYLFKDREFMVCGSSVQVCLWVSWGPFSGHGASYHCHETTGWCCSSLDSCAVSEEADFTISVRDRWWTVWTWLSASQDGSWLTLFKKPIAFATFSSLPFPFLPFSLSPRHLWLSQLNHCSADISTHPL